MPALFVFLFKVNLALLLFCAGYYLVLRHLTFYILNRAYLMAAILFATVYPFIDLSDFAHRHQKLAKPVQVIIYKWQLPARELLSKPDYWQWAMVAFWVGVVILGIRFLMQLFSLYMLYRNSKPQRIHQHDVRVIDGEAAPFSFWRSIYINPANHSQNDLEAILQHEQIHVNGWHTLDILLAELSCVFYWFNPGIWLIKKAVRENIEFITDRRILNNGIDSKSYQYSLVNVSFNSQTPGIVNHFNLSTIKKRIIMMNAKRSSRVNLTRYAFVIPVVICSLLVFTISKAEVAKPLTIKLVNAIKPVTIAIKKAAKDAGIAFADTVPAKNKVIYTTKSDTTKRKLTEVYLIKSDTGTKAAFTIKLDSPDSMKVLVDGKRISDEEWAKFDPNAIAYSEIVKDATIGNGKKTIYVITKDSEEGKALMKNSVVENPITKITINGITKDPAKLSAKEKAIIASLPNGESLKGKVSQVIITRRGDASTNAGPLKEVVIEGKNADHVFLQIDSSKTFKGVLSNPAGTLQLHNTPQTEGKMSTFSLSGATGATNVTRVYTTRKDNIDKISDKVIVIDGKVATEKQMKKLSAFDIESMSTSNDNSPDTLEKYGEKAKKGVVYITTKKAKN